MMEKLLVPLTLMNELPMMILMNLGEAMNLWSTPPITVKHWHILLYFYYTIFVLLFTAETSVINDALDASQHGEEQVREPSIHEVVRDTPEDDIYNDQMYESDDNTLDDSNPCL